MTQQNQSQQSKRKNFFRVSELIRIKATNQLAKITELDLPHKQVVVEIRTKTESKYERLHLWEIKKNQKRKPLIGLDYAYNQVRQFHNAFNHPVANTPTFMDAERAKARASWVVEEVNEFLAAETVVDQADACIDAIYFLLGNLVEIGVYPQRVLDIVQGANMAKLHNGVPKYREDGKIIKPANWVAPEPLIKEEIERQANRKKKA